MKLTAMLKRNQRVKLFITLFMGLNLLVVAIGGSSYLYTLNVYREGIYEHNLANLENVKALIELRVESVEKLAEDTYYSIEIGSLPGKASLQDPLSQYTLSKLIASLNYSTGRNSLVDSVYVYLEASDVIVDEHGAHDARVFFERYFASKEVSFEDWKKNMLSSTTPTYRMVEEDGSTVLTEYIKPFYVSTSKLMGSVVISYNNDVIVNMMNQGNLLQNTSMVIRYQPQNATVLSVGDEEINNYVLHKDLAYGVNYVGRDNSELIAVRNLSMNRDWEFIYTIPMTIFYSGLERFTMVMTSLFLIQLVLGCLLAVFFTNRSYQPIKTLRKGLEAILPEYAVTGTGDVIYDVQQLTHETVTENNALRKQLEDVSTMRISTYLMQMIQGNVTKKEQLQAVEEENIFQEEGFICVKIVVDDCSEFVANDSEKEVQLAKAAVLNVVEECFSEKIPTFALDYAQRSIILILNLPYDDSRQEEYFDLIRERYETSQKIVEDYLRISINAGVSLLHENLTRLYVCNEQAQEALNLRIVSDLFTINFTKEKDLLVNSYQYQLQDEVYLINSTKTGDYPKVEEILRGIIEDNHQIFQASNPLIAKCFVIDLISTMVRCINELNIDPTEVLEIDLNSLFQQSSANSLEKVFIGYQNICKWVNQNKKSHNVDMKEKIESYIGEHYMDNSLSLVSVADYMGLNHSYLSTFIKEQFGDTFITYVLDLRMKEAKRLLRETKLPQQDIAVAIGYANSSVFIRVFKKKFGYTPGNYRNHQNAEE